jgi:hypothetical protein
MEAKKLIYSVCTDGYDQVKPALRLKGWDYILFTDNPNTVARGWKLKIIPKSVNPCKQQRSIKILSHEIEGYDVKIYIDANFEVIQNPDILINKYMNGNIMTSIHRDRQRITQEAKRIIELKKDIPEIVMPFVRRMFDIYKMPDDYGLWENGLIIRKTSPELEEFERLWNNLLMLGSHRDQLSMPFASYVTNTPIHGIDWRVMYSFFRKYPHIRK